MVTLRTLVCSVAFLGVSAHATSAQRGARATQVINFRVEAIDQLAFNGTPNLVITGAPAGQAPTSVSASGGTWSVTTNHRGARITASIDEELPAGLTLAVQLAPPSGAQSEGLRTLSATPVDVITNLSPTATRDLPLTYRLDANVSAGTVVAGTRTVIFTITGGM
jgi:hypothetical protein